jgi:aspartate aminotransferase
LTDDTLDHEYLPILGLPEYTAAAAKLILGPDSPAIQESRVVSAQTISGTGANHLGALFLTRFYEFNGDKKVYLSNPTWGKWKPSFMIGEDDIDII